MICSGLENEALEKLRKEFGILQDGNGNSRGRSANDVALGKKMGSTVRLRSSFACRTKEAFVPCPWMIAQWLANHATTVDAVTV